MLQRGKDTLPLKSLNEVKALEKHIEKADVVDSVPSQSAVVTVVANQSSSSPIPSESTLPIVVTIVPDQSY